MSGPRYNPWARRVLHGRGHAEIRWMSLTGGIESRGDAEKEGAVSP